MEKHSSVRVVYATPKGEFSVNINFTNAEDLQRQLNSLGAIQVVYIGPLV